MLIYQRVIGSDLDFLPEITKIVVGGISKIHGQLVNRALTSGKETGDRDLKTCGNKVHDQRDDENYMFSILDVMWCHERNNMKPFPQITMNRWYVYHSQMVGLWHCFTHINEDPPTIIYNILQYIYIQCGAPKTAKLVFNSNNYGLWYL